MRLAIAFACLLGASLVAQTGPAARPSFAEWLSGVRTEALSRGIREELVDEALRGVVAPVPSVLTRDRAQTETVLSIETYISRQITAARLRTGRQMFSTHKPVLEKVSLQYGVPAPIVAGVWGVESNFGRFSGVRPTIAALATLAYDPRRATFFRQELFHALDIVNRGDIELAKMRGSWAGAMGQPQFMPSSYVEFAVDFDGNGRRDIWTSLPDVFGSVANYLKGHGWEAGQPWGREVRVSREAAAKIAAGVGRRDGFCRATRDMTTALPASEWQALGVRTLRNTALPEDLLDASLVAGSSRFFLVHRNFDALLEYNCSNAYALTVALLGEQIAAPAPPPRPATPARRPASAPTAR